MSGLADLAEARRVEGASRVARLRDAAEAIGEELRRTPVRSVITIAIDRLVIETRTVLPDARLVSPLVALERRALFVIAADGTRVLVDPSDVGPCTPYEERIASRHPVVHRALATRPSDIRWPDADRVVSTALALRSIVRARAEMPKKPWLAPRAEIDAAHEPSPLDLPRYARETPALDPLVSSREIAPGVMAIETPGPTPGHVSIAFAHAGKVFVHTHAGAVVDAWAPYESTLPGLREAVRLRNVEAVVRGDASDPVRALEAMTIERALADRRSDFPAFFRMLPAMELVPKPFMPRLRPLPSSLDP